VRLECGVHLFLDRIGQSVAANEDDRIEVVRVGPVDFALGGSELNVRHGTIIPA